VRRNEYLWLATLKSQRAVEGQQTAKNDKKK